MLTAGKTDPLWVGYVYWVSCTCHGTYSMRGMYSSFTECTPGSNDAVRIVLSVRRLQQSGQVPARLSRTSVHPVHRHLTMQNEAMRLHLARKPPALCLQC